MPFVLDMLGQPLPLAPADTVENRQVRDNMVEAWIAFACTGHPGWPMYRPGEPAVRCIGGTPELVVEPPSDIDGLWRQFWSQKE